MMERTPDPNDDWLRAAIQYTLDHLGVLAIPGRERWGHIQARPFVPSPPYYKSGLHTHMPGTPCDPGCPAHVATVA